MISRGRSLRPAAERRRRASSGSGSAPVSTGLKGTGASPRARAKASRPTPTVVLPTPVSVPTRKMPRRGAGVVRAATARERGAEWAGEGWDVASAIAAAAASTRWSIRSAVIESGGMRTTTEPSGRRMTPWRRTIRQTRAPMASSGGVGLGVRVSELDANHEALLADFEDMRERRYLLVEAGAQGGDS